MNYDAVICVGPKHVGLAPVAIRSVLLFTQARALFVMASTPVLDVLGAELKVWIEQGRVFLLDEEQAVPGLEVAALRKRFVARAGNGERFGWYLQQFLKMGVSDLPDLADHYLIWDGDTVLLRELEFFGQGDKAMVNPTSEHHEPYFKTMEKLLSLGRQVDHSFISEHMMVKKTWMAEMLRQLEANASSTASWAESILDAINDVDLPHSGFSEYETYGNFVSRHYRGELLSRPLKSSRLGSALYGKVDCHALFDLMRQDYAYVTFEGWNRPPSSLKRMEQAIRMRISWLFSALSGARAAQRSMAAVMTQCGH